MARQAAKSMNSTVPDDAPAMADRAARSPGHGGGAGGDAGHPLRGCRIGLAGWNGCRRCWPASCSMPSSSTSCSGCTSHKWRFTSMPELSLIVQASAVLAVSLLVLDYVLVSPNVLRHVLFRQDHHRALFRHPDRVPQRARASPIATSRRQDATPRRPRRQCHSGLDPGPCGRRRGAAPRDGKRRDGEDLAGRPAVAVAVRPRRQRPRRAGAGRLRRSRTGRGRSFASARRR